jgi:multicomponent Na+:H+ antiporter subunit C
VLILTAIVVGIATTSLGLALIVRINESYGTIEEDEVLELDRQKSQAELDAIAKAAEGASSK